MRNPKLKFKLGDFEALLNQLEPAHIPLYITGTVVAKSAAALPILRTGAKVFCQDSHCVRRAKSALIKKIKYHSLIRPFF